MAKEQLSSDYQRESISAICDGEGTELEIRRMLSVLNSKTQEGQQQAEELRKQWSQIHQIRDQLNQYPDKDGTEFLQHLRERIDHNGLERPPIAQLFNRYRQALSQIAVAASVALFVVMSVLQYQSSPLSGEELGNSLAANSNPSESQVLYFPSQPSTGFKVPTLNTRPVSNSFSTGRFSNNSRFSNYERSVVHLKPMDKQQIERHIQSVLKQHIEGATLADPQGHLGVFRTRDEAENHLSEGTQSTSKE